MERHTVQYGGRTMVRKDLKTSIMTQLMPDWKQRKNILDEEVVWEL